MLKLLRKYNKWILVIGGSLLMVAFLAPGAIQQCGFNPANRTVARMGGQKVSLAEFDLARRQYEVMRRNFPLTVSFVNEQPGEDNHGAEHWLLLAHAARDAGFVGEGADGFNWLTGELAQRTATRMALGEWREQWGAAVQAILRQPRLFAQFQQRVLELTNRLSTEFADNHAQFAADARLTPDQFDDALSTTRGISRMLEAYASAARLSDVRAARFSDDRHDSAYVDAVFIPASALLAEVPEPTEEQIAEHYEQFKDVRPGEGEYGIGYLLPPRVKVAWLTLDRQAIAQAVELNPIEVRKEWQTNRETYSGEFEMERPRVEAAMTSEVVDAIMAHAHRAVRTIMLSRTRDLADDGDYKVLPPDWEAPPPEAIAQAIVDYVRTNTTDLPIRNPEEGVTIPLPAVTVRAAEWLTIDELAELPGIGRSALQSGTARIPFPIAALSVRELESEWNVPITPQVGLPFTEPFIDSTGNRYYARVLAARPESPPDAPADIHDRIVADIKSLAAFDLLKERLEGYRTTSVDEGLDALHEQVGDAAVTRDRVQIGSAGTLPNVPQLNTEAVRESVLGVAQELDPLTPLAEQPIAARTVGTPVPEELGVVVARITALSPLTQEGYRLVANTDVQAALQEEFGAYVEGYGDTPFSYDNLADRYNFEFVNAEREQAGQ